MIVAAISNMWWQWTSRQKGQNERRYDHISSSFYRVEVLGDGCQHWNEEVKKENRDQRDKREWRS